MSGEGGASGAGGPDEVFDVIVVGAGVAGLTAAAATARGGARTLLLDRLGVGGQVSTVENVANAPGFDEPIAGYDLGVELLEVAESAGAEVALDEVEAIEAAGPAAIDEAVVNGGGFVVRAAARSLGARAIVIATGSTRRALGLVGEAELEGRGISHCASCDGPFFRERRVVVVGGGDSAYDEALVLAEHAADVLVVHTGPEPTARATAVENLRARPNARELPNATVTAVRGTERVESVTISRHDTGQEVDQAADGLFVYIGLQPNSRPIAGLVDLDRDGRVVVDAGLQTSRQGAFAAGDVRSGTAAMLAESATDGESAAASALEFLRAPR
ncbi:thioredoxin reductase [Pseudoclavibacter endophyticus]|uniref:NAD(P)-binding protein n=1 Tax=Pseudoclavibacter endophyticus TaxID=1778590 RepID=A0A6H9WPF2_9MICO|nr:FAD-dependent oxidoreductase [Pseudoclavibacter endophyticus]KAB1648897.1 NAD(P)-binding protein [Pseudoclavibacter endophyticus]GGA67420.1 thioredoxin reductase [Pseudoclavibacter endophyticus]